MTDTKFYVRMRDKFMSGWGGARGRAAIYVVECDTMEQAEAVEKAAQDRPEMKYITITTTRPRCKPNEQMTERTFWDLGGPWLSYCHWDLKEEVRLRKKVDLLEEEARYAETHASE